MDSSELPGYVYLIKAGDFYKIGRAKNVKKRLAGFSLPFAIELIHTIFVQDAGLAERTLHGLFFDKKMKGEWFSLLADDVQQICSIDNLESLLLWATTPKQKEEKQYTVKEIALHFDGKQRLEAVRRFLRDELAVFGGALCSEIGLPPFDPMLRFHVHEMPTRRDVLMWYLGMNSGGSVHTLEELARVRELLEAA